MLVTVTAYVSYGVEPRREARPEPCAVFLFLHVAAVLVCFSLKNYADGRNNACSFCLYR